MSLALWENVPREAHDLQNPSPRGKGCSRVGDVHSVYLWLFWSEAVSLDIQGGLSQRSGRSRKGKGYSIKSWRVYHLKLVKSGDVFFYQKKKGIHWRVGI